MKKYLIGYDIGSSSIKASCINIETGEKVVSAVSPTLELGMISLKKGWAEQNPDDWWKHVKLATSKIKKKINLKNIEAIGISYQMHGLVAVDKNYNVLRPAIIWCDSRAVQIGDRAFSDIGKIECFNTLLNSPGNFTASKLKWIKENEPEIFRKIYKIMLPGDYIAMKFTEEISTTYTGLSEGIFWDYKNNNVSKLLLNYYDIPGSLIPAYYPSFSKHGKISKKISNELGFSENTIISYKAGDQPNNAFSLNVLEPGQVATTAGTSGVIYGVIDKNVYDVNSKVNIFLHVNHNENINRLGVLLCLNGTGISYRWLKNILSLNNSKNLSYVKMNSKASKINIGSDGLFFLPYGNGAERTLINKNPGASLHGLNFNIHNESHIFRAAKEGIVFALNYGLDVMKNLGVKADKIRAGMSNMFLSPLFQEIFVNVTGVPLELYNTDGSQGAARGAGIGADIYTYENAFKGLKKIKTIEPDKKIRKQYQDIYSEWIDILEKYIQSA